MTYLLDTNACIVHLRSRGTSPLSRRFSAAAPNAVGVCSVVRAELLYGALRSRDVQRNLAETNAFLSPLLSLPFDDHAADACATIRASLAQNGKGIGPNDTMIAGIAVAHGVILITHNTGEFSRVPNLRIEDWQAMP